MSPRAPKRKAGGRRVKDQVVETTSAALALGAQSGRLVIGAIVAAALLLVVGEIRTASEQDTTTPPSEERVSTVAYGCPNFIVRGNPASTTVALGTLPGDQGDGGSRNVVRLPGGTPVRALAEAPRGAWATSAAGQKTRAVLVDAAGESAAGTTAYVASAADDANGGGTAVTVCPRPAAERWFVGAGTTAVHRTSLVLTNTSSSPGIVDIEMYGDSGQIDGVGADGIVVDPGESRVVRLDQLAAGETELAVHAVVRRGAVAIAATDAAADGTKANGSDFLAASAPPSTDVTIPGVVAHTGARTLLLANPTDRTATVGVTIATKDGIFTPSGLEAVEAAPQSVTTVRLPADISPRAYAVHLTSDVEVTATVRTRVGSDHAYAVASKPWEGTAVMPVRMGSSLRSGNARLLVTAADEQAATLKVSARDADGAEIGSADLEAPAGATVTLDPFGAGGVGINERRVAYLTVRTTSGSVRAAAAYASGGIAVTPLLPAPVREAAPVVRPEAP